MANPLFSDRDIAFLLYDVFDAERLCELPYFAEHARETFDLYLESARRLARDLLLPAYKEIDEQPPVFKDGRIYAHPRLRELLPPLVGLGVLNATRPAAVGGQQLPLTVASPANAYLMAANLAAYGYLGLTSGAAHLIETFGDDALRAQYMAPMYDGRYTGTMALTEPGAGSSLSDVTTRAVPRPDGTYALSGTKIFISGGDHDLAENIVHMTLARIEGAPAGIKGVSLFAVPRLRAEHGRLVDNDVQTAGMIHKIGWRGLPSLVLSFGERGDCRGHLVGAPHQGIGYMFQMMNEARIMVGLNGVATAAVAYQESLAYARTRLQGRPLQAKNPAAPQVPIIAHADVRRMLLRQKAIVEGGLALLVAASWFGDLAGHAAGEAERKRAQLLLDLLTPLAKSFPAEFGFESNALAVQIHGGYGYSSEYPVEAWLRDQKLNSIHEGTTGIQSLDLLGRKAVAEGGAALAALGEEFAAAARAAGEAGCDPAWGEALAAALDDIQATTMHLAALGMQGDPEAMLRHSADYLQAFSITAVAWQWLKQAAAARRKLGEGSARGFYEGKLRAAQYWFATEVPRVAGLLALCRANDDSYAAMQPAWFD